VSFVKEVSKRGCNQKWQRT